MKKSKALLAVVIVLAVAILAAGIYFVTRSKTDAASGAKSITVDVVHADGTSKTFTYQTDAEFLGEVLQREGLVQGTESDYGLYITTVDGEEAVYENDGAYWAFYVGEDYASQGVDTTRVEDGATYSLVYTTD